MLRVLKSPLQTSFAKSKILPVTSGTPHSSRSGSERSPLWFLSMQRRLRYNGWHVLTHNPMCFLIHMTPGNFQQNQLRHSLDTSLDSYTSAVNFTKWTILQGCFNWVSVAYWWSPTSHELSDLWHQQGLFLHTTTATQWICSFFWQLSVNNMDKCLELLPRYGQWDNWAFPNKAVVSLTLRPLNLHCAHVVIKCSIW